jgi:hypothetical protein
VPRFAGAKKNKLDRQLDEAGLAPPSSGPAAIFGNAEQTRKQEEMVRLPRPNDSGAGRSAAVCRAWLRRPHAPRPLLRQERVEEEAEEKEAEASELQKQVSVAPKCLAVFDS